MHVGLVRRHNAVSRQQRTEVAQVGGLPSLSSRGDIAGWRISSGTVPARGTIYRDIRRAGINRPVPRSVAVPPKSVLHRDVQLDIRTGIHVD